MYMPGREVRDMGSIPRSASRRHKITISISMCVRTSKYGKVGDFWSIDGAKVGNEVA